MKSVSDGVDPKVEATRRTLHQTFLAIGSIFATTTAAIYLSKDIFLSKALVFSMMAVAIVLFVVVFRHLTKIRGLVALNLLGALIGLSFGSAVAGSLGALQLPLFVLIALVANAGYVGLKKKSFSAYHMLMLSWVVLLILVGGLVVAYPDGQTILIFSGVGAVCFISWTIYCINDVIEGRVTNYIEATLLIFLEIFVYLVMLLRPVR